MGDKQPDGRMSKTAVLVTLLVVIDVSSCGDRCGNDNFQWQIPNHVDTGLCCPDDCKGHQMVISEDDCCTCRNFPSFDQPSKLDIEFIDTRGTAILISRTSELNLTFEVTYPDGRLQKMPKNICDFPEIVSIDLRNNLIRDIGNITCLKHLDTLNLVNNEIKIVRNHTFIGMSYLRQVYLSDNKISVLEPATLSHPSLALQTVDFSNNVMKSVDVTNVIMDKSFCEIDYSNNQIDDMVNELGIELDLSKSYGGGGMVSFRDNSFSSFLDFPKIGITDLTQLGKVLNYGFDFRGINITCDGRLVPLLELAKPVIEKMWRNYMNVTCNGPEELKGESIPKLVLEDKLDLFITHVSKCPRGCECISQPSKNRIIVNCSSNDLTEMPSFMPDGENLEIFLDGNRIKSLHNVSYLSRISKLDISSNSLINVDVGAMFAMKNISWIDLSGNLKLSQLPISLRNIHPCRVNLTGLIVVCDCSNTWINEWLTFNTEQCQHSVSLMCNTDRGKFLAIKVTPEFLDCEEEDTTLRPLTIALAIGILLCIGLAVVLHFFRYEIYILFRKTRQSESSRSSVKPLKIFDVYISCFDPNSRMSSWIIRTLIGELEQTGYAVCFPDRDFLTGSIRSEESIGHINRSRNFLLVMSEDFFHEDNPWGRIEWSHAWSMYRSHQIENIIIINYDQQRTSDINERRMKAFFRLHIPLDFANRKNTLIQNVKEQLGLRIKPINFGLDNAKTKFSGF